MKKRNLAESHVTADVVEIKDDDGKELLYLDYEQEKYNPIPFLYDGDYLVIGKCAEGHVDLLDAERCTHPTDFGRFFCNKYVVDWAYLGPSFASRNFYTKLQKDAMKWYNLDLSDYIILFKDKYMNFSTDGSSVFNDSPAYAIVLKDYVRGKEPVEYSEFINAQSNPPKRMNKFDKFRGESDTDVEARENYRLWHYGSIAENKNNRNMKKNAIKLNESQLRNVIAEMLNKVLKEGYPNTEDGNADFFAYERQIMSLIDECDDCLLLGRVIGKAANKLSSICVGNRNGGDEWFLKTKQWADRIGREARMLEDYDD